MNKINKALHGVIEPDICWHEQKLYTEAATGCYICKHCGKTIPWLWKVPNPDYFSKEGFWDAFFWIKESAGWESFLDQELDGFDIDAALRYVVDHKTFASKLYDFLVAEGIIK